MVRYSLLMPHKNLCEQRFWPQQFLSSSKLMPGEKTWNKGKYR
jgi:hypothetical protein